MPAVEPASDVSAAPPVAPAPVATTPGAIWERVRERFAEHPSLAAMSESLTLDGIEGGVATLEASSSSALNYARTRQSVLSEAITEISGAGARLRIEFRLVSEGADAALAKPAVHSSVAHAEAMKDPLVRRALELFGGHVLDVTEDTGRNALATEKSGANLAPPDSQANDDPDESVHDHDA